MSRSKAYIAIDVHARNCVLGWRNGKGVYKGFNRFETSEKNLVEAVEAIPCGEKVVTVEESTLGGWAARTLLAHVAEMVVCDPRRNATVHQNAFKNDAQDVEELSRLLWLGELKGVYQPQNDDRAIFKSVVQQYLDLRQEKVRLKLKIKAKYYRWGMMEIGGARVYSPRERHEYLEKLQDESVRRLIQRLYDLLDETIRLEEDTLKEVVGRGRRYPEIAEFLKMPGVGPVGAHLFDAFIQTPDRFDSKAKLWRYCQLAVTDRSSDNKPLGFRRLDKQGNPELKSMSFFAWNGALHAKDGNEVKRFYQASLERVHDRTHARLNTQRKIVATLWAIWKKKEEYRSERFLSPADAMER
jgi:transposase